MARRLRRGEMIDPRVTSPAPVVPTSHRPLNGALAGAGALPEEVGQAAAWLQTLPASKESGVWYDEIWESVLCMIALLRAARARRGPKQRLREDLASSARSLLRWLTSIPSVETTGQFINTHYSAFLEAIS